MTKMKRLWSLLAMIMVAMLSVSVASCGDDDDDDGDGGGIGNEEQVTPSNNEEQLVSQCVSSTIYYANYFWHINFSTSLGSKLPQKTILYGVEFGYGEYDSWFNSAGKGNSYNYGYGHSGGGNSYTLDVSVFDGASGAYENESFYARQYVDLIEKQNTTTLNNDQRTLLNTLQRSLPSKESTAKRSFTGRLYVDVDAHRYYIKTFTGSSY